ncbi:MAG: RNA methyltransferase [Bacteroidota bacterium]|nr:RNA methyltransferase [Bacteroidota bacterium]
MTPERREKLIRVLRKRQPDVTVVLENVFDPHNETAVMRTCDSVGIQDIFIINNRKPPKRAWGFRSGGSAKKWLTVHQFTEAQHCFKELRQRYNHILTTHLADNSVSLYDIEFTQSIALVFGNERFGVSEEVRALSDGNFVIPQMGIIQSLNISVACAISIYEAYRQKELAGHYNQPKLPNEQLQQLFTRWGFREESTSPTEEK